jgi:hypothetical protein
MRNRHGRFDRLKAGNNHDGTSRAFAKPGEMTLSAHHTNDRSTDKPGGGIARAGAPKRLASVPLHNGMAPHAIAAAGIGGMGHGTATIDGGQTVTSSAAAPVQHAYGSIPKSGRAAAPIKPGQRSQTNAAHSQMDLGELGRAIMDEAACDQQTRDALGYGKMK